MKEPNLPKSLHNSQFGYHKAIDAGLTKRDLNKLLREGSIERVSRGIYKHSTGKTELPDEHYRIATIRCGSPSSICLLSALEHYHLTDQIPKHVWVLVPASKRSAFKELKLLRSRNPQWSIGIKKTKHYWITTPERTLIDCLVHRQQIGSQIALEALKRAVAMKKVKLGDLIKMAKRMGVEHRILPYIEAMAA